MKQLLFIYNTHAGKGRARLHLADMQDAFAAAGWTITAHPTRGAGDAAELARTVGAQYDRIICSGGDGTLHEVVDGLLDLPPEARPQVGYVPAGTTNDFAKNLKLPRGMAAMAEVAAAGVPRPVDVGKFNDGCFIYVAAFGAFTDVSYNTPQQFKNLFGHLAYVLEAGSRLGTIRPYPLTVEHDGGVIQGDFAYGMVSNTVSVGGIKGGAGRQVKLDDGLFEVALVRQPKNPIQFQAMARALLQGTSDEEGGVVSFQTGQLKVSCPEELPWTLDGEYGGAPKTACILNEQGAVTVVYGK